MNVSVAVVLSVSALCAAQPCVPSAEPMLTDYGLDAPARHSALFDEDGGGGNPARLFLGGDFTTAGPHEAAGVARWDGNELTPVLGTPPGPKGAMRVYDDGDGPAVYIGGGPGVIHRYFGGGAWDQIAAPQYAGLDGTVESFAAFDPDNGGPRPLGLFMLVHYAGLAGEQNSVLWRYDEQGYYRLSGPVPRGRIVAYDPDGHGPGLWELYHYFNVQRGQPGLVTGYVRRLGQGQWETVGHTGGADDLGIRDAAVVYPREGALPVLALVGGFGAMRDGNHWVYSRAAVLWDGDSWREMYRVRGTPMSRLTAVAAVRGAQTVRGLIAGGPTAEGDDGRVSSVWSSSISTAIPLWASLFWGARATEISLVREFDPDGDGPRPAHVVLSGTFQSVLGGTARGMVVWELGAVSGTRPELESGSDIWTMQVFNDGTGRKLYAGTGRGLQRWTGEAWERVASSGFPPHYVLATAVHHDGLGWAMFTSTLDYSLGDELRSWDGREWRFLGRARRDAGAGACQAFAAFDADGPGGGPTLLYAGGIFDRIQLTNAVSYVADGVATWNGQTWSAVPGFTGGNVYCLKVLDDGSGPALYVGGQYLNAAGLPQNSVLRLRGSQWEQLPPLPDPNMVVQDIALDETGGARRLVVLDRNFNVVPQDVYRLENGAWVDLQAPDDLDSNAMRNIQDGSGTYLLFGRYRYTASGWEALPSMPEGPVRALSPVFDDGRGSAVFVGGRFEDLNQAGQLRHARHAARIPLCPAPAQGACHANCDGSEAQPVLNAADFTCFLRRYAAGDPWANCDGSLEEPVLNVADFACFVQRFAAGCK